MESTFEFFAIVVIIISAKNLYADACLFIFAIVQF